MKIMCRLAGAACLLLLAGAASAELPIDMAATMAVGGWQEREEVTVNAKGKVTDSNTIWMGVVGSEEREGQTYVWIEARIQGFKTNRKGERKNKGDMAIMKTLVEKSALGDFTNPMANMRRFGKEIVVKSGDEAPMRMREGGMMADMVMKAFGTNVDFQITDTGVRESVSVPAGDIDTAKVTGTGSVEMKVMLRTMRVESEIDSWLSEDVPMGVVKQTVRSNTNGKPSTMESMLIRYGTGATSLINDAEVQDMPTFKIPGFGNRSG